MLDLIITTYKPNINVSVTYPEKIIYPVESVDYTYNKEEKKHLGEGGNLIF